MRMVVLLAVLALSACAASPPENRVFTVSFADQSTDLDAPARAVAAHAAEFRRRHPDRAVHVIGYADPSDAAVAISKKRAAAVSAQLQADGVPAALIDVSARGAPPNSQPGAGSRRVEIDLDLP